MINNNKRGGWCFTNDRTNMAIGNCRKLVDLEDRSRRNNLQILGIKEECENTIYDLLEKRLETDTSNTTIERAHRVGENGMIKKGQ